MALPDFYLVFLRKLKYTTNSMKIRLQSLILNKVFKKRFDDVHAENSIRPNSAVIWCQYIISFISCFIYNSNTWSFSGIQALYKIEIQTLHCNLNKCSKNTTQGVDLDIFKHCSPYVVWNNVQLLDVYIASLQMPTMLLFLPKDA